ncbi:hypothetical protein Ahia01_000738900 [Argonauta hians]
MDKNNNLLYPNRMSCRRRINFDTVDSSSNPPKVPGSATPEPQPAVARVAGLKRHLETSASLRNDGRANPQNPPTNAEEFGPTPTQQMRTDQDTNTNQHSHTNQQCDICHKIMMDLIETPPPPVVNILTLQLHLDFISMLVTQYANYYRRR